MIGMVLMKKDMLSFVQYVRVGLSDHHVVVCKVRLVGTWIKRREEVDVAWRIRSEKETSVQRRIF